jgi:hypothetical protein
MCKVSLMTEQIRLQAYIRPVLETEACPLKIVEGIDAKEATSSDDRVRDMNDILRESVAAEVRAITG